MDANLKSVGPFFRDPEAGYRLNVLGVTHIYKATGAETDGAFSLWEALVPPGNSTPCHTHSREDESLYVLSGEVLVELEDETVPRRLSAGGFFFGARGRRHAIRNVSDRPARLLILSTPSRGLDQMFAAFDSASAAGSPDTDQLATIASQYGVTIARPTA